VCLPFFTDEEVEGLDPQLVSRLEHARGFSKTPFIITSGYRTPIQNQSAGGVMHSSHTKGLAVDLSCRMSHARYRMVSGLILAGFNRIGLYTNHMHADMDESLPQDVLWLGGESH
jgi:uncharacterized protein YcbK (DUF882 family)